MPNRIHLIDSTLDNAYKYHIMKNDVDF